MFRSLLLNLHLNVWLYNFCPSNAKKQFFSPNYIDKITEVRWKNFHKAEIYLLSTICSSTLTESPILLPAAPCALSSSSKHSPGS